jgi:glutamate-ammonia-ligase adenylyltransferase
MTRSYGAPLERDEKGRVVTAEMVVIALGKLGCRELNYASDIDLLFLYSSPGTTAGDGRHLETLISNKQFFTGVAERVVQMIGSSDGEGAVYRTDLRLRPYGRDGDLVWDLCRAVDYYRHRAEGWERQTLIRARASAGSERVATRFLDQVRDVVFSVGTRVDSFEGVRRVKEKIDRAVATRGGGFNVKLGPGGIREIEFIAQALQLEYGGREPWVRSTQTLIVLARLMEKGYLSKVECTHLSAAYTFLRTVEHRLQMEHGAQTHTLPRSAQRLKLVARRCGYLKAADPASSFLSGVEKHTGAVRSVYNRIFAPRSDEALAQPATLSETSEADDETGRTIGNAVQSLTRLIDSYDSSSLQRVRGPFLDPRQVEQAIRAALPTSIDPIRSLKNICSWSDSLSTYQTDQKPQFSADKWRLLVEKLMQVLSSPYLASILISRPRFATVLVKERWEEESRYIDLFRADVSRAEPPNRADALRRCWYERVIEIGYRDMMGVSRSEKIDQLTSARELKRSNLAQTALAEAALRIAVEIALEDIGAPASLSTTLPFAVLALGRLGHAGMDYGSDLDLLVVFDDSEEAASTWSRVEFPTPAEFYSRLTSQLVSTLGSITREGMIYRVDLRLRPEGKSGQIARGLSSLLWYISSRASAWEHSAYLKAREVAGCLDFGARVKETIAQACFDAAARNPNLRDELYDMRMRLESEKARGGRPDTKWGPGGVTDAYFITRYLQLAHRVSFPPERGTGDLIDHLGDMGVLDRDAARDIREAYTFLRRLDHWMRLLVDRPTPKLPAATRALRDVTLAMGLKDIEELESMLADVTTRMRRVFNRAFGQNL